MLSLALVDRECWQGHPEHAWGSEPWGRSSVLVNKQPGGEIKVRKANGESREVTEGSTRAARTESTEILLPPAKLLHQGSHAWTDLEEQWHLCARTGFSLLYKREQSSDICVPPIKTGIKAGEPRVLCLCLQRDPEHPGVAQPCPTQPCCWAPPDTPETAPA